MKINERYVRISILVSTLILGGGSSTQCTIGGNQHSSDDNNGNNQISVSSEQKISANSGGFNGSLNSGDQLGRAITDLGDLEPDGISDLAVGAPFDGDGGTGKGAAWVLFMNNNGRVIQEQKISSNAGGFGGNLDSDDQFGSAVAGIGDLDGDGSFDLAVGVPGGDDGGLDRGEVWITFLDTRGRVLQQQRIANNGGGFTGNLSNGDRFGSAVADIGDVNGDGVRDLAVGAPNDDEGADNAGAVWILMMGVDGKVVDQQKIARNAGGFSGNLNADDQFGSSLAGIGDLDNDGIPDLVVGAPGSDEGGADRGGVWILFLDADGRVRQRQRIADSSGGFDGNLNDDDRFGSAVADIGDMNGDGIRDLAVGAPNDDDGGTNAGAVWVLMMDVDGRVASLQKIGQNAGKFNGNLSADDQFGAALAGIGDLDNDGVPDLAVGTPGDDDGGDGKGGIWILFMDNGTP